MLRGRVISTTYEYDDNGRITRSYASPSWTADDHDVMLALAEYEGSLCPGCGHPKEWAWNPGHEPEGWFEVHEFTCHACSQLHGPERAVYKSSVDTFPLDRPKPPWPDEAPAEPAPPHPPG